jgi:beta-N-acetylhexosaminidase
MTIDDKVGQLLFVGVSAADPREGFSTVQRYHLGGVFLRGRSSLTPGQLKKRLEVLQSAAAGKHVLRLHVAVDQEGGRVHNLQGQGFTRLPAAAEQATWDDQRLGLSTAEIASQLHAAGVSVNLAPVADVVPASLGTGNPPVGAPGRQYGATPESVVPAIRVVVGATQQQSVLATLKHFPGLGRVTVNTDYSSKAVDDVMTATDPYLAPFRAGIEAGAVFVMVSSARYPHIDPDNVATFSPAVVSDLLRGAMHFDGVIMTDDVGAAVALRSVPVGDRAVRFIRAGGDVVLTIRLSDAAPMTEALEAEARRDTKFAALIDDAVRRVAMSKVKAGLVACTG